MKHARLILSFLVVSLGVGGVSAAGTPSPEDMKKAHEILGISQDLPKEVRKKQVKSVYRKLAIKWHPDKRFRNLELEDYNFAKKILGNIDFNKIEREKLFAAVFQQFANYCKWLEEDGEATEADSTGIDPKKYFSRWFTKQFPDNELLRVQERAKDLDDHNRGLIQPSKQSTEEERAQLREQLDEHWHTISDAQNRAYEALQKMQKAEVKKQKILSHVKGDDSFSDSDTSEQDTVIEQAKDQIVAAEKDVKAAEIKRKMVEDGIEARKDWGKTSKWNRLNHLWNYGSTPPPAPQEDESKDDYTEKVIQMSRKQPHYTKPWAASRAWQRAQSVGLNPSLLADAADLALFTSGSANKIRAGSALSGLGRIGGGVLDRSFVHEGRSKAELFANHSLPGVKRKEYNKAIPAEFAPDATDGHVTEDIQVRGGDKDAYRFASNTLETLGRISQPVTALTDSGYSLLNASDMAAYNRYLASKPTDKKEAKYARSLRNKKRMLATLMALEALLGSSKYWAYTQRKTDPSKSYVPDAVLHSNNNDAQWVTRSNKLAGAGAATALLRRIMMNIVKANHIERAKEYANMEAYRKHAVHHKEQSSAAPTVPAMPAL